MPLPAQAVVRALAFSTTRYLEELENNRGNERSHVVQQIAETKERVTVLEGEVWHQYHGIVNDRPKLSQDSSAIFRTEGVEHEVRILKYNKQDGQICFACREVIQAPNGQIVVSFRSLVKRVLAWIERRGPSVCDLDNLSVQRIVQPLVLPEETSNEQSQAAHGMLQSSLSYVWGPPGTGKSRMVLASGVAHCVEAGNTVILLAPTNLAVDHALDAVIERLANSKAVLRLGTPTPQFMVRHPNCCEAEVFKLQVDEATKKIENAEK
jgi:primosomal protein N'